MTKVGAAGAAAAGVIMVAAGAAAAGVIMAAAGAAAAGVIMAAAGGAVEEVQCLVVLWEGGDMALPLDMAVKQLAAAFSTVPIKGPNIVRCERGSTNPTWALRERAGGSGRAGQAITVVANHFKMEVKAKQAFHYDVSIERLLSEEEQAKAEKRKMAAKRGEGPQRHLGDQ
eukprot:gene2053-2374_t